LAGMRPEHAPAVCLTTPDQPKLVDEPRARVLQVAYHEGTHSAAWVVDETHLAPHPALEVRHPCSRARKEGQQFFLLVQPYP